MSTDNPTFSEWFNENRESGIMQDAYWEYCYEHMKDVGDKPLTYRQWAKERFEQTD